MHARSLRRLFLCTSVSLAAPLVGPHPLWSQVSSTPAAPINTYNAIHHPVVGRHGMVASQNAEATRVGVEILRRGGNAVDAAVGVGLALAVTLPRAGNLGGGGFLLVHLAADEHRTIAVDFTETAPAAAFADMYFDTECCLRERTLRAESLDTSGRQRVSQR